MTIIVIGGGPKPSDAPYRSEGSVVKNAAGDVIATFASDEGAARYVELMNANYVQS